MSLLAELMFPPPFPNDASIESKPILDALKYYWRGKAQYDIMNKIGDQALEYLPDAFDSLDQQKKKLEIEMMKRQLGKYENDDAYEKEMNLNTNALLAATNAKRYSKSGKKLIETLIGDSQHGSRLLSKLTRATL